jgi:uncharacterized cupin superfamily protein
MKTIGTIHHSNVRATDYEPFPLDAVEGDPNGKVHWLKASAEGEPMLYAGLFTGEPSVFTYTFGGNETFNVLEGEVRVELDSGETVDLSPGDLVTFPKGAASTWYVKSAFKKFFVISE